MSVPFPALVQFVDVQTSGTASSVTTAGINTSSGNLLVACVAYEGSGAGPAVTPITDNNSLTWSTALAHTVSGDSRVAVYYSAAITGRSGHTVTFTTTGANFLALVVLEITQISTGTVLGSTNNTIANTTTHSSGNITSATNEIWIGLGGMDHTGESDGGGYPYVAEPMMRMAMLRATATQEGIIVGLRTVASGVTGQFTWTPLAAFSECSAIVAFNGGTGGGGGGGEVAAVYLS